MAAFWLQVNCDRPKAGGIYRNMAKTKRFQIFTAALCMHKSVSVDPYVTGQNQLMLLEDFVIMCFLTMCLFVSVGPVQKLQTSPSFVFHLSTTKATFNHCVVVMVS